MQRTCYFWDGRRPCNTCVRVDFNAALLPFAQCWICKWRRSCWIWSCLSISKLPVKSISHSGACDCFYTFLSMLCPINFSVSNVMFIYLVIYIGVLKCRAKWLGIFHLIMLVLKPSIKSLGNCQFCRSRNWAMVESFKTLDDRYNMILCYDKAKTRMNNNPSGSVNCSMEF